MVNCSPKHSRHLRLALPYLLRIVVILSDLAFHLRSSLVLCNHPVVFSYPPHGCLLLNAFCSLRLDCLIKKTLALFDFVVVSHSVSSLFLLFKTNLEIDFIFVLILHLFFLIWSPQEIDSSRLMNFLE